MSEDIVGAYARRSRSARVGARLRRGSALRAALDHHACVPEMSEPSPTPPIPDALPTEHQNADPLGELLPPVPTERSVVRRTFLVALAVTLLLLGVVFWLLPVMTGIPFWMAGLVCLAKVSDRVRRLVNRGDRTLPDRVRRVLRWARDKATRHRSAPSATATPEP